MFLVVLTGSATTYSQSSANFTAPDTICLEETLNVSALTPGASSYDWNFCSPDAMHPQIDVISNSLFNEPVYMDYVQVNFNYYGFVTNYKTGELLRLDFGDNLLNNPTVRTLGNFSNTIPGNGGASGIQLIQDNGNWYAIIVAGYPAGGTNPRLIRISFGNNILNLNPIPTNLGDPCNMYDPQDLVMLEENGTWYGFTVNAGTNTISRFSFPSGLNNSPVGTNLSNIGSLTYPLGLYVSNEAGTRTLFVTNGGVAARAGGKYSLSRLTFPNGLANQPEGVNIGNVGNTLQHPRDLALFDFCNSTYGLVLNAHPFYNDLLHLDFGNNITSQPHSTILNNPNKFLFPYSFSKFTQVDNEYIGFVVNKENNTISRIHLTDCTNASPATGVGPQPPPVSYSSPGNYIVTLTMNKGQANESSTCKEVYVKACKDDVIITQDTTVCTNQKLTISTYPASSYKWTPTAFIDDPSSPNPTATVKQTTRLYVEATLADNSVKTDSILISVLPSPTVTTSNDTTICEGSTIQLVASGGSDYAWSPGVSLSDANIANPLASPRESIRYYVSVTASNQCITTDSVDVNVRALSRFQVTGTNTICAGDTAKLTAAGGDQYQWDLPGTTSASETIFVAPRSTTSYNVLISDNVCEKDSMITVPVQVKPLPEVRATSSNDINCTTPTSQLSATGAESYNWSPVTAVDNAAVRNPVATADVTTVYTVKGTNSDGCSSTATVTVTAEKTGAAIFAMPNAFTPNNDGKNDCFGLQRWGGVKIQLFRIFNRWGQMVYESSGSRICWDGTFRGVPQQSGSYHFVILAETFCGPVKRTGLVTLIR